MNKTITLVFATITLVFVACSGNSSKPDYNLKGKVRHIRTTNYYAVERFGKFEKGELTDELEEPCLYDNYFSLSGLMDSTVAYNRQKQLLYKSFNTFENDKIIAQKNYNGDGSLASSYDFSYNEKTGEQEEVRRYDAKEGRRWRYVVRRSPNDPSVIEKIIYDENGDVNYRCKVKEYKKNGTLVKEIVYNSDGDVERVAEYNNDGKILIDSAVIQESVSRWVYNKKGDVEYMESARRGDYHYSYEYDSKGNWIKKIWYSGYHDEDEGPEHDECNPVYIQERVIEYY